MKVVLLAYTALSANVIDPRMGFPYEAHPEIEDVGYADELAEAAGRSCYLSWKRPNPLTATNKGYLRNILDQGHFSVLEHASATFWISGVSRSLTHELVRHRHLSFSQVSQRYVDESEGEYITHPALEEYREQRFRTPKDDYDHWHDPTIGDLLDEWNADSRRFYKELVDKMVAGGVDRKTARGAARGVLPNATATQLIVSGNHRTWREVLQKRLPKSADAEIRGVAIELLGQLKELAPNTYQDIEVPE